MYVCFYFSQALNAMSYMYTDMKLMCSMYNFRIFPGFFLGRGG